MDASYSGRFIGKELYFRVVDSEDLELNMSSIPLLHMIVWFESGG